MIKDETLKLEIENVVRTAILNKLAENKDAISLIKNLDTSKLPAKIAERILEVAE